MFSSYRELWAPRSGIDRPRVVVDIRKLWTGGVVTSVIVCGLAIAGFLLVQGMLGYPLLSVSAGHAVGHASMYGYAGGAILAALMATAAMHFLLVTTPQPRWFFGWLGGVGTAIAVLLPLAMSQDLGSGLATATINLILGVTIIGLVRSTVAASRQAEDSAEPAETFRVPLDEG